MPVALSVNINKIALIRNSREGNSPQLETFAQMAIDAGAAGITVHPRPDQRHIRACDIAPLALLCRTANVEFNIEGNPFAGPRNDYPGLEALAINNKPDQCTLVPDSDAQLTSDHGFDLVKDGETLKPIIARLKEAGIRVSLFMDPNLKQIERAAKIGADRIELYTGPFAAAYSDSRQTLDVVFKQHCDAAEYALSLGLGINAGHDLNLENMQIYRDLPGLQEVSIGHALTVESLLMGFSKTVQNYRRICQF
jgi:pyridoxine 5-phosphate synthase